MSVFYDEASLVVVPSGYKSGKIYAQKPLTTDGQLTFSRASTATRVNASGLIESVASGVPRLDYTNSTCPKLLLEPQRTNLIPSSEDMTAGSIQKLASGTGTAPAVTANQGTAPNGTTTADLVVFDIAAGTTGSDVSRLFYTNGSVPINASVYVKSSNGSSVYNMFFRCGNSTKQIIVTGQWQRFDVTEPSSGANWQLGLQGDYDNSQSASVLVWGAQLEQGAYATSYIPTTTAAVTRLQDVASKTGISSLIGQTEGTLFVDVDQFGKEGNSPYLLAWDGTFDNRIQISSGGTGSENKFAFYVSVGGTNVVFYIHPTALTGRHKLALAYKLNDVVGYIDGVQVFNDTSATIPSTSALQMAVASTNPANAGINQALLFKTRLSNAKLAELTSL
jgi:hypothetical protein